MSLLSVALMLGVRGSFSSHSIHFRVTHWEFENLILFWYSLPKLQAHTLGAQFYKTSPTSDASQKYRVSE